MMGKPTRISKPQKSSKNKKIKSVDPFYTGNREVISGSKTKDAAPKHLEQELPRSVKEIKESLSKKKRRKRNKGDAMEKGMTKKPNIAPVFKQLPGESIRAFNRRMDREVKAVLHRSQLADKFHVDFEETEDGKTIIKKKTKKKKKTKQALKIEEKIRTRKEERIERKKERALTKKDTTTGFEKFKDKVQFGEVVMEPPTLSAKPRKGSDATNRPGVKSLLLKEIITQNSQSSGTNKARELGQTTKRKHMSMAQQHKMDIERTNAIDLYRQMKAQKLGLS